MKHEIVGAGNEAESRKEPGEKTLITLKSQAVDIGGTYFKGVEKQQRADGKTANGLSEVKYDPLTWNENSGIIMFADKEGNQFATPSNDKTREMISSDPAFKRAEGKGVLNLGDVEGTWGDKANAENSSTFRSWREFALRNQAVQEQESQAIRGEQQATREAFDQELNEEEEASALATRIKSGEIA